MLSFSVLAEPGTEAPGAVIFLRRPRHVCSQQAHEFQELCAGTEAAGPGACGEACSVGAIAHTQNGEQAAVAHSRLNARAHRVQPKRTRDPCNPCEPEPWAKAGALGQTGHTLATDVYCQGAPRATQGNRGPVQPLRTGALGQDRSPGAKMATVKDDERGGNDCVAGMLGASGLPRYSPKTYHH